MSNRGDICEFVVDLHIIIGDFATACFATIFFATATFYSFFFLSKRFGLITFLGFIFVVLGHFGHTALFIVDYLALPDNYYNSVLLAEENLGSTGTIITAFGLFFAIIENKFSTNYHISEVLPRSTRNRINPRSYLCQAILLPLIVFVIIASFPIVGLLTDMLLPLYAPEAALRVKIIEEYLKFLTRIISFLLILIFLSSQALKLVTLQEQKLIMQARKQEAIQNDATMDTMSPVPSDEQVIQKLTRRFRNFSRKACCLSLMTIMSYIMCFVSLSAALIIQITELNMVDLSIADHVNKCIIRNWIRMALVMTCYLFAAAPTVYIIILAFTMKGVSSVRGVPNYERLKLEILLQDSKH